MEETQVRLDGGRFGRVRRTAQGAALAALVVGAVTIGGPAFAEDAGTAQQFAQSLTAGLGSAISGILTTVAPIVATVIGASLAYKVVHKFVG